MIQLLTKKEGIEYLQDILLSGKYKLQYTSYSMTHLMNVLICLSCCNRMHRLDGLA